jgi:serine/threonine-protein kinase
VSELRLEAGTVFAGDFRIIRPLRTGGQGSLWVVEQISTSKHRALKLMLPELVANATSRKRFELEAKIAARIQSDHIVESIASGVDVESSVPWLVMELLEGEDLAAHIQKRRALPPSEVLEIFGQLCHALGEAHRQGIVHRDLKPENIFLSASRRRGMPFMVKVLDFGIARVMAEAKTQSAATVTGLGTPMWMAPEQTIPGGRVEPSTDVWPLGLLAFRLLTGYLFWKAPYDPAASVLMLMAEAFMHPMPTATARAGDYKCAERIPAGFDAWFAKAVARNMDDRFADAGAAFAALEPILAAALDTAGPPSAADGTGGAAGVSLTGPAQPRTGATPPVTTGPGRGTWEGAPELSPSVVNSVHDSEPPGAPAGAAAGTGTGATPAPTSGPRPPAGSAPALLRATPTSATGEHPPPVQKPAPAPAGRSLVGIIAAACLAGVVVGGGLFAWSRSNHRATGAVATPTAITPGPSAAPAVTGTTTAAAIEATPDAAAPEAAEADAAAPMDSAAAASSATGGPATGGGKLKKLCKPVGQKCLSNDDCCDRVCRAWSCRANHALKDPYGGDGK